MAIKRIRDFMLRFKLKLLKLGEVPRTTFIEFCESSSINGVRYITERRLHWSERICWIIAIALSFWMCIDMIHSAWVDWQEKLTAMNTDGHSSISSIPFPTVTICPMLKATNDKFDLNSKFINPREFITNLSNADYTRLDALAHICYSFQRISHTKFKKIYNDDSVYDTIKDIAPNLDHVMNECRWKGKPFECSKYFAPIITSHGLCYTFNALNSHDFYTNGMTSTLMITRNNSNVSNWNWDNGYLGELIDNEYPLRVADSGPNNGLEMTLIAHKQDHTSLCTENDEEFIVQLSTPGETADFSKFYSRASMPTSSLLGIEPKLITTSEALRSYTPKQRGCFYDSERQLAFFQFYSLQNCIFECMSNYTIMKCGCVPFYMSRHSHIKVCGAANINCYLHALQQSIIDIDNLDSCNCLDSCNSIEYSAKMDAIKLNLAAMAKAKGSNENYSEKKMSKLAIFFKNKHFDRTKRSETNTIPDFLAFCGGVLGLFLGMTTLSIIEIVYYLSLRLFWNFRNLQAEQRFDVSADEPTSGPSHVEDTSVERNDSQNVKLSHVMSEIAKEFCDNGCFHGFKYLSEKRLYWIERFLWIVSIIASFGLSTYLIVNIWIEWNKNPVKMTSGKPLHFHHVPYPTVTICPETKALKSKFDLSSALKNLHNLSEFEESRLKALAHICPRLADQLEYTDQYMDESIFSRIESMAMNIADAFVGCAFEDLGRPACFQILAPVLTDEGLCFSFNTLNSHDIYTDSMALGMMNVKTNPNVSGWSLDSGYANLMGKNEYPIRVPHVGFINPFGMGFKINKNKNNQCKEIDEGIKVILTAPGDPLKMSRNYYRVPISKITKFKVSIKWTTTSAALRRYAPNQRQCFYGWERQLRFFKDYTQNNCEAECVANFTKLECGCVKFSMPRDRDTKICGSPNIICYRLAEKKLRISESAKYYRSKCNCMPLCTSIEYSADIVRTNLDEMVIKKGQPNLNDRDITIIEFVINTMTQKVERQESSTWIEFSANCGGSLALFFGISVLSIIELIYYPTLRLFWAFRRLKSKMDNRIHPIVETISKETLEQLSLECEFEYSDCNPKF